MPEPLDNKYPRVNFRMGAALQAELIARGESPDAVAKRDLERYYYGLKYDLKKMQPQLTLDEWCFLVTVSNGTIFQAQSIPLLWAEVDDAVRDGLAQQYHINGPELISRFRSMSYFELLAVVDGIERFWSSEEYHIEDMVERIYALKLVQRRVL